jgi:SAM-dependent methyltransferase
VPRRRLESNDLRAAWERNAADWIRWTRDPAEFDGHYVRYHRGLFLELLPPPPARALDLGCGEGRLSRDLVELGYDVVGVDVSPAMVAAALEAAPEMEIHLAVPPLSRSPTRRSTSSSRSCRCRTPRTSPA